MTNDSGEILTDKAKYVFRVTIKINTVVIPTMQPLVFIFNAFALQEPCSIDQPVTAVAEFSKLGLVNKLPPGVVISTTDTPSSHHYRWLSFVKPNARYRFTCCCSTCSSCRQFCCSASCYSKFEIDYPN